MVRLVTLIFTVFFAGIVVGSQSVIVDWDEVHFKSRIGLRDYSSIEVKAHVVETEDVIFIDNFEIRLDDLLVALPKSAYSDLYFPILGTIRVTYHDADSKTLYQTFAYHVGPNHERRVKTEFTIDVDERRVIGRRVYKPNDKGKYRPVDETVGTN